MNFEKRCALVKKIFGRYMDIFFDAGPASSQQEAYEISKILPNVKIYGFEASSPRYEAMKDTYTGEIFNVMLGECKKTYTGYLGGAKLCKVPIDNFRINITKEEAKDERIGFVESTIECITLDDFYYNNKMDGKVFVWADIEGSELSMIKGSIELMKSKTIIGFNLELSNKEWFPKHTEVLNFLDAYGYEPIESPDLSRSSHKDVLFKLKLL